MKEINDTFIADKEKRIKIEKIKLKLKLVQRCNF